jgi:hypothetical protein
VAGRITRTFLSVLQHFGISGEQMNPELSDVVSPVAIIAECLEDPPISDTITLVGAGTLIFFVPGVGSVNALKEGTYRIYMSYCWRMSAADPLTITFRTTNLAGTGVRQFLGGFLVGDAASLQGEVSRQYTIRVDKDTLVEILSTAQAATSSATATIVCQKL